MFSLVGWGGGERFSNDEDDDLLDSGDGDGVVSRDDPPDAIEADDENDVDKAAPELALCLT